MLELLDHKKQLRQNLWEVPEFNTTGTWPFKNETFTNLENSLAENRPRALIQMATGGGHTLTDGATLTSQPGVFIPHRDRRTRQKTFRELDDDLTYTATQSNRPVPTFWNAVNSHGHQPRFSERRIFRAFQLRRFKR